MYSNSNTSNNYGRPVTKCVPKQQHKQQLRQPSNKQLKLLYYHGKIREQLSTAIHKQQSIRERNTSKEADYGSSYQQQLQQQPTPINHGNNFNWGKSKFQIGISKLGLRNLQIRARNRKLGMEMAD